MPDRRRHRGPHPEDGELFAPRRHDDLRAATSDLAWLLGRGYAETAALKLVGDRFALDHRQRLAVRRAACSDAQREARWRRRLDPGAVAGRPLWIDGFNVLVTIEAALAGGVLLRCSDGCLRDMASIHGSYRTVEETPPAVAALGRVLGELAVGPCRVLLDRPVSNSGRLRAALLAEAERAGLDWTVELRDDVDASLCAAPDRVVVASADAGVLDRCGPWFDLASAAVAAAAPGAAPVMLSCSPESRNLP